MASWCMQWVSLYQYAQFKKDQVTGEFAARMEVKYAYKVVVGRPKEKTLLEELDWNGRMILKVFLKKQIKNLTTQFIWFTKGRLLINKIVDHN